MTVSLASTGVAGSDIILTCISFEVSSNKSSSITIAMSSGSFHVCTGHFGSLRAFSWSQTRKATKVVESVNLLAARHRAVPTVLQDRNSFFIRFAIIL